MASNELKHLHPYLYRRVRLKGILYSLLGLSSIFHTYLDDLFHTQRNVAVGLSPIVSGAIFLIIGMGILFGLYSKLATYKTSKVFLYLALVYAIFWEFILVSLLFTRHISTIALFILWGYLTYNLILISRDSGWAGALLMKKLEREGKWDGGS